MNIYDNENKSSNNGGSILCCSDQPFDVGCWKHSGPALDMTLDMIMRNICIRQGYQLSPVSSKLLHARYLHNK